jgi:terminase large subunit-like protein
MVPVFSSSAVTQPRTPISLTDPALLGASLGNPATWSRWLTALKAAFGIKLTRSERRLFKAIAGSRKPPKRKVQELWACAGRGSGKSRMTAAVAVYLAAFLKHDLDPGEIGHVLVLAGSRDQAQAVFSYASAFLRRSPILRKIIKSTTAHEIRLTNGVTIAVHTNSFRLRGKTLLATIFDEVAYWRDDSSANPDQEVYRAVRPSLARTGGMLVGISSPYRQVGLLHQKYKDHFGVDDADCLVVHGATPLFNPTIDKRVIAKEYASDPESARSEWGAEFRSDVAALLDINVISDAVDYARPLELPPRSGRRYHAFVDASAGRHDAFSLCIGHLEGEKGEERFVCDVIRGRSAPFDPRSVAQEYAQLAREYGCSQITGDNFAGEWVSAAFSDAGARYEKARTQSRACIWKACPHSIVAA